MARLLRGPHLSVRQPFPPPRLAGSGPSFGRAPSGGTAAVGARRGRGPPAAVGLRTAEEPLAGRAPGRPRRPRRSGPARARSVGARARLRPACSARAPAQSALLPHPRRGWGGSSSLPSPERPRRRPALNERHRLLRSPSASLGGGGCKAAERGGPAPSFQSPRRLPRLHRSVPSPWAWCGASVGGAGEGRWERCALPGCAEPQRRRRGEWRRLGRCGVLISRPRAPALLAFGAERGLRGSG